MNKYFVEYIGHPFARCAVPFPTYEQAVAHARATCGDAMLTDVYDCTRGPNGVGVLSLDRSGKTL